METATWASDNTFSDCAFHTQTPSWYGTEAMTQKRRAGMYNIQPNKYPSNACLIRENDDWSISYYQKGQWTPARCIRGKSIDWHCMPQSTGRLCMRYFTSGLIGKTILIIVWFQRLPMIFVINTITATKEPPRYWNVYCAISNFLVIFYGYS